MNQPLVSVLIGTSNRPEVLVRCVESVLSQSYENIEILVFDNSPHLNTCEVISEKLPADIIKCIHVDESYGVSGSRNELMKRASGDIFVVIDDDAYFNNEDALQHVVTGFDDNIGIQAFKIIDHPDDKKERILAPISQSRQHEQSVDVPFRTAYFVGGGHAIRREVIDTCGDYNDDLIYGAEEIDLSYRAIEEGFEILYNPDIVVHHYPEPPIIANETMGHSELYYSVKNKLYIAYRYLPLRYLLSYVSIWLTYYAAKSLKSLSLLEYLGGIAAGIGMCRSTSRSPISPDTEKYLKSHYGRLRY